MTNALQFQTKKYKSIIENMNLGLMEVDANETILNVNNAFVKMCGYSPEGNLLDLKPETFSWTGSKDRVHATKR